MRKSFIIATATAVALAGCGKSSDGNEGANASSNEAAQAPKPAAYCFFKDSETKDWKASVDTGGNVIVSGKAYREDSRYKAVLSPATVNGGSAEVAPTIAPNDTGFAAPGNWWDVSETIPSSGAVTTVTVKCGDQTIATLSVPRKK
jgi:hypothetical protein